MTILEPTVLDKLLEEARPEQKAAVTAREPIVVVGAGAGTGKTKTLAWRFLWALLAFPETRVENILTLTFTEKAAREMRERIAAMLESARKDAEALGLEDAAASRLSDARNRLDEAYISTIHAFALRVIRESGLCPAARSRGRARVPSPGGGFLGSVPLRPGQPRPARGRPRPSGALARPGRGALRTPRNWRKP